MKSLWQRLLELFRQRWFITLIGVIALAILIWFGGTFIKIADHAFLASAVSRLLLILAIVVIWGLLNLRAALRAGNAARGMAQAMVDRPEQSEDDPATEEVTVLADRLRDALGTLKRGSDARRGRHYLYELPWYVLIGPPGSGKTRALEQSGLEMPLADRYGGHGMAGVGGTRNCDWWFTDRAVFLDTAGRYTTQDSHEAADRGAWHGFLALLRKHRPRQPVNGAIVAVSAHDLLVQTAQERGLHARAIGERVQELATRLGVSVPVYVMVTKVDLIAGFSEFFDDLGREERDQVWGATFDWNGEHNASGAIQEFAAEFDALIGQLNDRVLWRLHQERDPERRGLLYAFPQRMAALREHLDRFLHEAFAGNRYRQAPMVRGVYFSSATQKGAPVDRLYTSLAASFGLRHTQAPAPRVEGRPYFLKRLFQDLVLGEAGLVGTNRKVEQRRAWLQRGAYAGAVVAAVVCALAWSISFTRNQSGIQMLGERIADYRRALEGIDPETAVAVDVLPALNALKAAVGVFPADPALASRMGLYQGDDLRQGAIAAYRRVLNGLFLPGVARRVAQQLRDRPDDAEYALQALRVYLMLGKPRRLQADDVQTWMTVDWRRRLAGQGAQAGQLDAHLITALRHDPRPVDLNEALVDVVRRDLTRVPVARRAYLRLKHEARADLPGVLSIPAVVGPDWHRVFAGGDGSGRLTVPRLYTSRGFHEFVLPRSLTIAKQAGSHDWVLDSGADGAGALEAAEVHQLARRVRGFYFDDYIQHWDSLLDVIRVKPAGSLAGAASVLDAAAAPDSPLVAVLRTVRDNTRLQAVSAQSAEKAKAGLDAAQGVGQALGGKASRLASIARRGERVAEEAKVAELAEAVSDNRPRARVADYFRPIHALFDKAQDGPARIDHVMDAVRQLNRYVNGIADAPDASGRTLDAAVARMSGGGNDAVAKVREQASGLAPPVSRWLAALSGSAGGLVMAGARAELNAVWQSQVYPQYRRTLLQRYPLDGDAADEVTIADFAGFFGPGGTLERFFQDHLAPFVNTRRWRTIDGNTLGLPNALLTQFRRAQAIRDAFFANDGSVRVEFTLKPLFLDRNVSRFTLDVGGQRVSYRHGPQRITPLVWPSPTPTGTARVVFVTLDGRRSSMDTTGPWAWFRLLDRAQLTPTRSDDRLHISFEVQGERAEYQLRASSVNNPFDLDALARFRLPSSL